jgi:hypothetical protein
MALPAVTTQDSNAVLRKTYAASMKTLLYGDDDRFLLGAMKKSIGGGESFTVPLTYGGQPGRSKTFASALANRGLSKKVKFQMEWTEDFAQAIVNNTAISLSKGVGAVVNLKMAELANATETLANSIEHSLIRSGYNEIGQISVIASQVVTFASRVDTNFIDVGQSHTPFASLAASTTNRAAAVVAAVDRDAGTVTYTGALTNWAVSDFVFQTGDKLDAGNLSCIGLGGWFPLVAPSGVDVGGVDRSVAAQQLAGVRIDGRGRSAKEACFDLITRIGDAGGKGDVILSTNDFVGRLVKEVEGTTVQERVPARDADGEIAGIFYKTLVINGPKGPFKIKGSPYMYSDRIFGLTMDTLEMRIAPEGTSKDPIFNGTYCSTNSPMIDDPSTDSQIARIKALFLMVCNAPQKNGVCQIA